LGRAVDVPGEIGVVPVGAGGRPIVVRFAWGPRDEMFTEDGRRALLGAYRMGVDGNRVGVRLRGEGIGRVDRAELVSEGLVLGAIQVTADGQPLVFLADHPTTGGYPVIGVVDALGVARLAQGRPGDTVIFRADGSGHGSQRRPG
jgi:allophanate hydrolase subunit 2